MIRGFLSVALGLSFVGAMAQGFDRDYHKQLNGTVLHFRVRGSNSHNPYLVILPGGPGFSATMFYPWGHSLESSFTVVYLDQRGCGESERLKFKVADKPTPSEIRSYTMANLTKDIEAVRSSLGVKKWFVLGHSWGGMLGLEYALAYPQSISGYIHVDGLVSEPLMQNTILTFADKQTNSDLTSSDANIAAEAKRMRPYIGMTKALTDPKQRMLACMQFAMTMFNQMYFADASKGNAYQPRIRSEVAKYKIPLTQLGIADEPGIALLTTYGLATRDLTPLLPKIKTRTLVINGKQDHLISPGIATIAAQTIPHAKLLLLDHCGHFPFIEQPEAFTAAIKGFGKG